MVRLAESSLSRGVDQYFMLGSCSHPHSDMGKRGPALWLSFIMNQVRMPCCENSLIALTSCDGILNDNHCRFLDLPALIVFLTPFLLVAVVSNAHIFPALLRLLLAHACIGGSMHILFLFVDQSSCWFVDYGLVIVSVWILTKGQWGYSSYRRAKMSLNLRKNLRIMCRL
jgi:hypothetical protein